MVTRPGYIYGGPTDGWVSIGQDAAVNPFKYQATAPTSPATGDIWVDSDDFVPSIDSAQFLRWRKTMSGGQTSLSGADDASLPLQYTPGYEQVHINGVLMVRGIDYTATDGTTITGLTALVANDVVEVFSAVARTVADVYTQSQADAKYNPMGVGYTYYAEAKADSSNTSTSVADWSPAINVSMTKRSSSTKLLLEGLVSYSPQTTNVDFNGIYIQINGVDYELMRFASGTQYALQQRSGAYLLSGLAAGTYTAKLRYNTNGSNNLYAVYWAKSFIKVTEVA